MTQQTETMPSAKRTLTAGNDYRSFLRALKKGKWTIDQLTGEADRPEKLQALVELMGAEKYEASLIRAFDKGDVDRETGEVLWVEHKKKTTPSAENGEPKLTGTGSDPLPPPPAPPVMKTHEQIQRLVDEAVEKNGANILDRADGDEILTQFGLKREEVTERMVERADNHVQRKLREHLATENDKASNRGKVSWEGDEQLDPALNADHPIRGAAAARREMGERSKNLDNGDGKGHIIQEGDDDTFTFNGENEMKLSEKAARSLLIAAGIEAKTWGAKKLAAALNDQERLVEATEPEDEKQKEQFNTVLKAVADGNKVYVMDSGRVTEKKTSGEAKKSSGKGRKKREGEMSCVDAIEKVLSETKKEMTAKELVEAMAKKGYWSSPGKTPAATVGARIYVDIQKQGKKSRFVKVGKGTFGIKK